MSVTSTGWLYVGLIASSAVTTTILGAYAVRHRREPGARGFALTMAVLTVWTGCYAIGLLTYDPELRTLLRNVQWIGTSVYVWLLLFALEYTGHDELATKPIVGAVALPWVVSWALVWTAGMHDLWWSFDVVEAQGLSVLEFTYGPAFWLHTAWSYLIILLASALLLRLVFVSDYLYTDQSALLLAGIGIPLAGNVVHVVFLEPGAVVDVTPIAFALTGVAFSYALFRHRLFDLVPATRRLGRNAAIGQLETGIVIVDTDHRIVYCNEAAEPVLGCDAASALDRQLRSLVDVAALDFDAPDALAEIERSGTVYEVRSSPITDRNDRTIGHTLVAHDVTARKRRERTLAAQRDELEALTALNRLIRGVVQALVTQTDREGIERAVCERIVEGDLYHTACIGDAATWEGDADRWTTAGAAPTDVPDVAPTQLDRSGAGGATPGADVPARGDATPTDPDAVADPVGPDDGGDPGDSTTAERADRTSLPATDDGGGRTWIVVPVVDGRTVYGAIGLATDRETLLDREREILDELGRAVGHAIHAAGTRQLLSAETVVQLELESDAAADPIAAVTDETGASIDLAGLVADDAPVAYLRVDGDVAAVRDALDAAVSTSCRSIRSDEAGGLLEWRVAGDSPLGAAIEHSARVETVTAADGRASYEVEVPSEAAARRLADDLEARFGAVRVVAKREQSQPTAESAALPADSVAELTDRQQEALEAAYRAGYFEWPRDSTAEDVAEALDISPSTLHSHLRKAEGSLFAELFDDGSRSD